MVNKKKVATKREKSRRTKGTQKATKEAKSPKTTAARQISKNRGLGIALFKLAGRPTKEQFIHVYGDRGPRMTWEERARAGVPAKKFQAALAAKSNSRAHA